VSNHHLNTLAGYVIAAMEMKEFGKDYADQTVRNAKKLAERLYDLGFKVIGAHKGFTESHQVAVDVRDYGGGEKVASKLEKANIILNKNLLPWDSIKDTANPSGIRIGVQELTRLGMKESEMEEIAELIYKILNDKISIEKARESVKELKIRFNRIKYTFEEHEAYNFPEIH